MFCNFYFISIQGGREVNDRHPGLLFIVICYCVCMIINGVYNNGICII